MKFLINSSKILVVLFVMMAAGCQSSPDYAALRAEILDLHQAQIDAHLEKDVEFFTQDLADDYFSVGNGQISHPSKEEIHSRFESYLNSTSFTEYRNLEEPIVGFSDDGLTAWSIVRVKVAGKRSLEDGQDRDMDFTCAWITLYKREGDRWLRMGEVSSF